MRVASETFDSDARLSWVLAALAGECFDNGYTRLSWAVLNWNTDAIALYDGVGAQPQREWTTYRVSGSRLAELAGSR